MGAQLIYGTAGATGGGWSAQRGSLQPALVERGHEPRWQWQGRAPKTWKDRNWWYSLWSYGCRVSGGSGSGADGEGWYNMASRDLYEPYSCDGEGCSVNKFIRGTVVDSSDVAVANAIVQGFRTSDDAYVGQDVSRDDGTYVLATDNAGSVQHYLVAYKPGSPDTAGTTVNTLTPTNVDGT